MAKASRGFSETQLCLPVALRVQPGSDGPRCVVTMVTLRRHPQRISCLVHSFGIKTCAAAAADRERSSRNGPVLIAAGSD